MKSSQHPQICHFPSKQFYEGALKTGKRFHDQDLLDIWPRDKLNVYPHVFVHINGEERALTVSTEEGNEQSRSNMQEIKHVVSILHYSYYIINTISVIHYLKNIVLFSLFENIYDPQQTITLSLKQYRREELFRIKLTKYI